MTSATHLSSNLHTHTFRCHHASGDVEDYCREAEKGGLQVLGMSDHVPLPDNRWPEVRMAMDELPDYLAAIESARKAHPKLRLLKAMECEWAPEYESFYREELLGRHGLDYLICGAHYFPAPEGGWKGVYGGTTDRPTLRAYADYIIASMQSGLFSFVAHPDLFGNCYPSWDAHALDCSRAILEASHALNVPLEINGYGMRKKLIDDPLGERYMYPWAPFWELAARYDIGVVVSSDAHRPEDVARNLDEGMQWVSRYELNWVDPLRSPNRD